MDDIHAATAEQTFFDDPALDRMFGVIFRIASELQMTRLSVRRMEALLEHHGIALPAGASHLPAEADRLAADEDRRAYVENILSPLLGRPSSRSAA